MKAIINRRDFVKTVSLFTMSTTLFPIKTLAKTATASPLRFGLVSDSHYAERDPRRTRFYKGALEKMEEFVSVANDKNVDFIMHLGDLKDEGPEQDPKETLQFLKTIEQSMEQFQGPRYHCIGNHDVDSITKGTFLTYITNTNISKAHSYYSFDHSGWHFVVLDANYDANGRDHYFAEGANWQDTRIPDFELDWLKKDLENTQLPTIVFCHHPLFEFFRNGYKYHVNNYKEVQACLEASQKVVACIQGHVHEERYTEINGIHYITQLGMVDYEGLANNSFSMVTLRPEGIEIKGYKRATDQNFVTAL